MKTFSLFDSCFIIFWYQLYTFALNDLITAYMSYNIMIKIVWKHVSSEIICCYRFTYSRTSRTKLGDAWYVSNVSIIFYAPCLFYTNYPMFYLCFGTLFMHFPELTYWQDVTVPVSVFCCFWFQKSYTGNILGIGRFKSWSSYFHETKTESEGESKRGHRVATRGLGAASPGPSPRVRVGPPGLRWLRPFAHIFSVSGKP